MKRNVISLLLALVLVFAVTVALAPTAEAAVGRQARCICYGSLAPEKIPVASGEAAHTGDANCTHYDSAITWTALSTTGMNGTTATELSSGYYYIDSGSEFNSAILTIPAGAEVTIDLNGYKLKTDTTGKATLTVNGTLHLCDTSDTGAGGVLKKGSATARIIEVPAGGILNIYRAKIFNGSSGAGTAGANVNCNGGTVNMYGGLITDGTATKGSGGNVVVQNGGTFRMYKGTISDGMATTSGKHGGNIYITKGTFEMHGGTISGGQAGSKGGNVMLMSSSSSNTAAFIMTDGSITGGAAANGGSVAINGTAGTTSFTMTGGSISGGEATTNGDGVYVYQYSTATNKLVVGGTAKITGNGTENVYLAGTNAQLLVSTETALTAPASIGVTLASGVTSFASGAAATDAQYFFGDDGSVAAYDNGALSLVENHSHCWCVGADTAPEGHANCSNTVTWVDHAGYFSSNKLNFAADAQYVYLSDDVAGSLGFDNAGNVTEFFLCLNGFRLRGTAPITVPAGITLTVCDCGSTGRVMSSKTDQSVTIVTVNGTLRWVSGTIQGLDEANEKTNRCVVVNNGATAEIYGGVIENGSRGNMQGGNVLVQDGGTFKMFDGIVRNGAAGTSNGGNISVPAGGNLQITGGAISGGSAANGGNIYVKGTANISGNAEISNGTCTSNGDNIRIDNGNMVIDSATITLPNTNMSGYNISIGGVNAEVTIKGNTSITGGGAHAIRYGAGSLTLNGTLTLSCADKDMYLTSGMIVTLGSNFSNGGEPITVTKAFTTAEEEAGAEVQFTTGGAAHVNDFVAARNGNSILAVKDGNLWFVPSTVEIEGDVVGYATLAEALAKNPITAITLNKEITETGLTLSADTYINLNGFNLASVDDAGYALNIYDSTNRLYTGTPGKYAGANAEELVVVDTEVSGASTLRKYLNIKNDDDTYSPHRVFLSVTAVSINPGQMRLNYKAMFVGDAAVKAYVEQVGYYYGLKFQVGDNNPVYSYINGFTAFSDQTASKYTQKLIGVQVSAEAHTAYNVTATAFIAKGTNPDTEKKQVTVADSDVIATSATTDPYSFRGLVQSADQATDLSSNSKTALYNMYTNNAYMANWGLQNIPTWAPVEE